MQRSCCAALPTVFGRWHDRMPELPGHGPGRKPPNRTEGEAMTIRDERPTSKRAPQQQGAFVAVRDQTGALACYYNPQTRQVELKVKGKVCVIDLSLYHREEATR
jgi:hypothetical protein